MAFSKAWFAAIWAANGARLGSVLRTLDHSAFRSIVDELVGALLATARLARLV